MLNIQTQLRELPAGRLSISIKSNQLNPYFRGSMRLKIILAIVIVAALAAYFILSGQNRFTTLDEEEISFAIDDPDKVSRIYIVSRNADKPVLLEKTEDGWTVNGKYKAWQKKVNFLLYETLPKIEVKGPAPKAARANVISKMAVTGVKVEIYTDDPNTPVASYYVGHETANMMGTYFWKEGAKTPYVVYVPGIDRYLTPAYIFVENEWISRTIFEEESDNIRRIAVSYKDDPVKSFEITRDNNQIQITTDPRNPDDVNISAVKSFLNHFSKLNFEDFASLYKDSVVNAAMEKEPFVTLELENNKGETVKMEAFYLPSYDRMHGLYDKDGNMLQYDPNRFIARASNIDKLVVIQDYTFRKVLVSYADFLLSNAAAQENSP